MLSTPTIDKLHPLALAGMARALLDQLERPDYAALSFEERLGLLVDREMQDRENRRLARHLKAAHLRSDAVIEDLDLRGPRGLDRSTVLGLAEGHWVTAHRTVLVTGPTGVGKTFLACALAHAAIRRGHTALYLRVPRLLDEPATSTIIAAPRRARRRRVQYVVTREPPSCWSSAPKRRTRPGQELGSLALLVLSLALAWRVGAQRRAGTARVGVAVALLIAVYALLAPAADQVGPSGNPGAAIVVVGILVALINFAAGLPQTAQAA